MSLPSLTADPVVSQLASAATIERFDTLSARHKGFGVASAVWFFLPAGAPDMSSLDGKVEIVAAGGADAGRTIPAQVFWSESAGALGVMPAWGEYMVPEATYLVLIKTGVTLADGTPLGASPGFAAALAAPAYAPLAAWLGSSGASASDYLVGTVLTTEPVLPLAQGVLAATDKFPLEKPTMRVRWEKKDQTFQTATPVEGAALDAYFGVPEAPFLTTPGAWGGDRDSAKNLSGYEKVYPGGTGHFRIGRVLNGSIMAPVFNHRMVGDTLTNTELDLGTPSGLKAMIPFSLFLCEQHLQDPSNIPVVVFSHGGGAIRGDAIAVANAACTVGVATVAIDMIFHGGRRVQLVTDGVIVPAEADQVNFYTGKKAGDPDYVTDWIGDPGAAAYSVGPMFGGSADLDPAVIEANFMQIIADTQMLIRLLKNGDWSGIQPGLGFDASKIFHASLSFGTSFHTALLALSMQLKGAITSVGTGNVLSANLTTAPSNAAAASALAWVVLGLKTGPEELTLGGYKDLALSIHQWLHSRADPLSFATYVLRNRPEPRPFSVLASGDSWDETLFSPPQLTYNAAFGTPVFTHGADWTLDTSVPGADRVTATPYTAPLTGNLTVGATTYSAGLFFYARSCHAELVTALCGPTHKTPFPPLVPLDTPVVERAPTCALHGQIKEFLSSLLTGPLGTITAPTATCDALYGTP